jgi:hypothetical protein
MRSKREARSGGPLLFSGFLRNHAGTHNNHLLEALIPQSGTKRGQRWFNQVSRELGQGHTVPNRVGKQSQCCTYEEGVSVQITEATTLTSIQLYYCDDNTRDCRFTIWCDRLESHAFLDGLRCHYDIQCIASIERQHGVHDGNSLFLGID